MLKHSQSLKLDHVERFAVAKQTESCNKFFKILIIGDSNVGKSAILSRYCYDIFSITLQPTIGIDFGLKKIKDIKLQIWDTGGLERFNSIRNLYYRGINGYVVVYDIMEPNSIININRWLEQIVKYSTLDDYVVMIVGNKTDMVNSIEKEEYVDKKYDYLIKNWIDMPHIIGHTICSAMNNYNINTIFDTLFKNFNPRSVYINKTVKIEINKNQSKCC